MTQKWHGIFPFDFYTKERGGGNLLTLITLSSNKAKCLMCCQYKSLKKLNFDFKIVQFYIVIFLFHFLSIYLFVLSKKNDLFFFLAKM